MIRLFDIVSNYDKVEFKYEGNQKKLVFEKSYPHAEIRSIEVVSNNRNSLNLVTAFYTKKNRSQSSPTVASNTIGNSRWGSTSNNSIPQNSENSSGNAKKSLSVESDDLAPIGNYNVYGKDVALEEELHLIREDIAPAVDETVDNSVAPERGGEQRVDLKYLMEDDDIAPPTPGETITVKRRPKNASLSGHFCHSYAM